MQKLELSYSTDNDKTLAHLLAATPQLNTLILHYCKKLSEESTPLPVCKHMTNLDLGFSDIDNEAFARMLVAMPNLKTISMGKITEGQALALADHPTIEELSFSGVQVDAERFQHIARMKHVKKLTIMRPKSPTVATFEHIAALPQLRNLRLLGGFEKVIEEGIQKLSFHPTLSYLELHDRCDTNTLVQAVSTMPSIQTLACIGSAQERQLIKQQVQVFKPNIIIK